MMRACLYQPAPAWLRGVFVLPFVVGGLLLLVLGGAGPILGAAALLGGAAMVWIGRIGVYPALTLGLFGWALIAGLAASGLSQLIPVWAAFFIMALLIGWAVWVAVRIGAPRGAARVARCAAAGRVLRDWEWVATGPEFARAHPMGQFGGALYLVAGFVVLQWVVCLYLVIRHGAFGEEWLVFAALSLLTSLTLYALVARRRGARGLVWIHLILSFPLSLPLIVYWADGRRPNLTYAHRFERLVPLVRRA